LDTGLGGAFAKPDKLNGGYRVLVSRSLAQWRWGMVMDTSEPGDFELRALCMECGQFRSKKVSIKPENQDAEEMGFLLEITSSHDHKDTDRWAFVGRS